LVYEYRQNGHRIAQLDPLGLMEVPKIPELDPAIYDLHDNEYKLDGIVNMPGKDKATLPEVIAHLIKTYTGKCCFDIGRIGYEFTHLPSQQEQQWFQKKIETHSTEIPKEEKKEIQNLLTKSQVFDFFMAKKFPQVKRYGLQGGESMMVVLNTLFKNAALDSVSDGIVCMPHRGRLNLLTGILNYPTDSLFHKIRGGSEFPEDVEASGDVLSHLAISTDLTYGNQKFHVNMLHNPSHLEAANPVALGKARARQMYFYEGEHDPACSLGDKVICVQVHGDAAFTGQGVVTETLGLSNLPHFTAGGSIHLIVNNQIGYTTPGMNARSTVYTSDVGKMINCPVLHVNGVSY
jgi:probable 2-oxoglutarate dehydrogenase E1 component DHKTD1